jgi:hypothetical protein
MIPFSLAGGVPAMETWRTTKARNQVANGPVHAVVRVRLAPSASRPGFERYLRTSRDMRQRDGGL